MRTRRWMVWLGSALVATGAFACNADEEPAGLAETGGGGATGTGGAGHAGTAGTGGSAGSSSTGGSAGNAGSATVSDAGPDQSVGADASQDAPAETGSKEAGEAGDATLGDAADGGTKSYALAIGSNFTDGNVKLVAVDWATKTIAGSSVFTNVGYADAIPVVSGGRGFMIERTDSKLVILQKDQPWLASKTVNLLGAEAGPLGSDPVAVVSTGAKAYVPLLLENKIDIVDVDNGVLTGGVDLSSLVDAADTDKLVDVFDGVYDAAAHRAYFLLLNIPGDQKGIEPDRVSRCIPVAPSIIGVDTTNDQLVDLNGDAGGKGFTLLGRNPTAFVPDLARGRVLVIDAGCYEIEGGDLPDSGAGLAALPRVGRGIEAINLATGTSSWLYTHTESTRLSGLALVDATHAFISADDAFYTTHWYPWDPSNGATHGAEALTLPQFAPHFVGGNLLVGLAPIYVDGGSLNAFVSFNVGTSAVATLVPDLFGDPIYTGEYNGWALYP